MPENIETFSTGSQIIDCVIGGGWPVGAIISLQGDAGSGKTALGMEAGTNHLLKWPDGQVHLIEKEPTCDLNYFASIGTPLDKMNIHDDIVTIEDYFNLIELIEEDSDGKEPCLIILDSFDSLSDNDEMERSIEKGTMGAAKAKLASQVLRRKTHVLEAKKITLLIVQQLRDVLNSPVPMKKPAGGKAVEFYAGLAVRLTTKSKLKKMIKGVERIYATEVEFNCIKSKIGKPFRKANFNILFDYGVDDLTSNLNWLGTVEKFGGLEKISPIGDLQADKKNILDFVKKAMGLPKDEFTVKRSEVAIITKQIWDEVENLFAVTASKY